MEERCLRWNVEADFDSESHNWIVLLINQKREISRILEKLYEEVMPIDELMTRAEGSIEKTGLKYKLVSFKSFGTAPKRVKWEKIYNGKVVRDRELYERQKANGLEIFVNEKMEKVSAG